MRHQLEMFDINEETLAIVLPPRCGIITRCSTSHQNAGNRTATPMRHHHEMLDIPSERWQPYCHPDAASSRDARHPRRTLASYMPPPANSATQIDTDINTRCSTSPNLDRVYDKSFLRRRSKTDNEFNPSTSPEDNQLVIKEGGTMNTITFRSSLR
jgi:hypothetical protein